jgi:hypothetical protein
VQGSGCTQELDRAATKLELLPEAPGQLRDAYRMRFRIPIASVERLRCKVERPVLEDRLPPSVGDIPSYRQHKAKERGRHDVTDRELKE